MTSGRCLANTDSRSDTGWPSPNRGPASSCVCENKWTGCQRTLETQRHSDGLLGGGWRRSRLKLLVFGKSQPTAQRQADYHSREADVECCHRSHVLHHDMVFARFEIDATHDKIAPQQLRRLAVHLDLPLGIIPLSHQENRRHFYVGGQFDVLGFVIGVNLDRAGSLGRIGGSWARKTRF